MTTSDDVGRYESAEIAKSLEQQLVARYGVMIANEDLRQVLGYTSKSAFRQALKRQTVGVLVFGVPNRRGRFALSKDIAEWLAAQRALAASRLQQRTRRRASEMETDSEVY